MVCYFFQCQVHEGVEVIIVFQDEIFEEEEYDEGKVFIGQCSGVYRFYHLFINHYLENPFPDV